MSNCRAQDGSVVGACPDVVMAMDPSHGGVRFAPRPDVWHRGCLPIFEFANTGSPNGVATFKPRKGPWITFFNGSLAYQSNRPLPSMLRIAAKRFYAHGTMPSQIGYNIAALSNAELGSRGSD
jgi:hypothetical protein